MKKNLLILFILSTFTASAQRIEKFFDYNWRPCEPAYARFFAVTEFKENLWQRFDFFIHNKQVQMQGAYKDSACKIPEGTFYYYHPNGRLQSTGKYENGKREGAWLHYYSNGVMQDSAFYKNGQVTGTYLGWHPSGYMKDSIDYKQDGPAVSVTWFDNGTPSSAGRTINDSMHGKWVFYHKNGNRSAAETYNKGVLTNRQYYNENGEEVKDTSKRDRGAEFSGGQKAWERYLLKNAYFPDGFTFTNSDRAVVVISFVIDEEGKVTEAEVYTPFYPAFDEIALRAIKNSPKWKPAVKYNRNVKYYARQPVTFQDIN